MARFDKPLPYRYLQAPFSAGALTAAGSSSGGERASARLPEASNGVSELLTARRNLPTAYPSFEWPVGTFRRRIRASDELSAASNGLSELRMARRKLGWPVGSLDGPSEGSDGLSEAWIRCRKLGYAVGSSDTPSEGSDGP